MEYLYRSAENTITYSETLPVTCRSSNTLKTDCFSGLGITTKCLKLMHTLFETLFLSNEMRQKYNLCCVVFYSLNFLTPVHGQNAHLLPQYTPNNDVEQSDIPAGLFLIEYNWWHVRNSMKTGFLYTNLTRTFPTILWGSCKYLYDCISTLVISGISLFSAPTFQHNLAKFHQLQTCLGFLLLLPLYVVVYQIPTLQRRWTSTTSSTFK